MVTVHIFADRLSVCAPAAAAAIVCLAVALNQRLRRVIELIVGIGVGVGLGELLTSSVETGPWQGIVLVALAISVAVLLDCGPIRDRSRRCTERDRSRSAAVACYRNLELPP